MVTVTLRITMLLLPHLLFLLLHTLCHRLHSTKRAQRQQEVKCEDVQEILEMRHVTREAQSYIVGSKVSRITLECAIDVNKMYMYKENSRLLLWLASKVEYVERIGKQECIRVMLRSVYEN